MRVVGKPWAQAFFLSISKRTGDDSRPGIRRPPQRKPCPCSMANNRPCPQPDECSICWHVLPAFRREAELRLNAIGAQLATRQQNTN